MTTKPQNILYLSTFGNLRWGGQRSLFHLVTRLDRLKYRPYVLLPTDEDFAVALRQREIQALILDLPRIKGLVLLSPLGALSALAKVIEEHDIRLIHTDGPRNTLYAGLVARWKSIPLVFHVRSSDRERYDPLLYALATRVILVADALQGRFAAIRHPRKLVTIYNGVDLNDFSISGRASQIRPKYNISPEELVITCIGRIEPMKGQRYLIEACARLASENPALRVLCVGESIDQDYLRSCQEMAQQLGISDLIIFTGHEKNVPQLLYETDIFVLPSSFGEAFSRAIIEAMAMGKAIIATDVGGAAEAIEDGVSGFIVPPGDAAKLSECLLILARDPTLRRRFGKAARERVESRFSIEENICKTQRLYEEILAWK
ncbi:MAG: glycosyltransferase family 4 protein [Syntrophales bacterium]